jgi:hypothetical protein
LYDTYSMEFDLKVETDNITSTYIAASQIGWAVILVIMYLEAFKKTDVIVLLV